MLECSVIRGKQCSTWFWLAVLFLLGSLGAVQLASIRLESATWDEPMELASGYSFLKTGEFRIEPEHPPLAKILAALPLLALKPRVPLESPFWQRRHYSGFGDAFLYDEPSRADALILAGRLPSLVITALLGLSLAIWARRHFGSGVALFTLALYSVDPNVIAYGRYLKNDILVTFLGFVFWLAWSSYLEDRSGRWKLLASGVLLGLALATKFSAVFLIPAALLLAAVHRWRTGGQPAWHRVVLRWQALTGIAASILLATYGPENRKLWPMSRKSRMESMAVTMADTVNRSTASGRLLSWIGRRFGWRDHALATGLGELAAHATAGHPAYLLGRHSMTGWWYYFPVAFLVKTPVATLAAVSIAVAMGVVRAARHSARKQVARLRDGKFSLWTAAVPIAVYVPICLLSRINTGGVRHLLPIYPFLFVLVAAGILASGKRWAAVLAGALILCAATETFSVYPHETAFFNRIVGGPANGPRYLVDSNIDWGQDLKKLVTYVNRIGVGTICLAYFGTARPESYRLNFIPLHVWLADPSLGSRCLIAISATPLMGVYVPVDRYAWLRAQTPVARVGYSIYLYDATRPPQRGAN